MKNVRISIVSYLNTIPFNHGIEQSESLLQQIEISKDIPAECARKLIAGEVDLGLIPVAAIPEIPNAEIISDYCIGAVGPVKSVLLLSEVPLEKIERIYLDYQSRTSVALCRILCEEYWHIDPEFIQAEKGYESQICGNTAGVIIGDRTFHLADRLNHRYDLAEEWQKFTDLPFVFACWVSNTELPKNFRNDFNQALNNGLAQIDEAIATVGHDSISRESLHEYLTKYIQFELDDEKLAGLNLFLEKISST